MRSSSWGELSITGSVRDQLDKIMSELAAATAYRLTLLQAALGRVARDESGQTMAEYAVLISVIAAVVVTVAITLGGSISSLFSSAAKAI